MLDMDVTIVVKAIEALFIGKRATELLPELPKSMKPNHIRVLDIIYKKYNQYGTIRVTDVATSMQITLPSVTKLINELVDLGTVKKLVCPNDKRVVLVELLPFGKECVQKYVLDYHWKLAEAFSKLDTEKYLSMIETIEFIYRAMKDVSKEQSNFLD